jgi:dihydrodipicolinate reductase
LSDIGKSRLEVIVDVSSPEGTTQLITKLIELNLRIPLIIGTTGDLPNKLINHYSKKATVIVCPNFSISV